MATPRGHRAGEISEEDEKSSRLLPWGGELTAAWNVTAY